MHQFFCFLENATIFQRYASFPSEEEFQRIEKVSTAIEVPLCFRGFISSALLARFAGNTEISAKCAYWQGILGLKVDIDRVVRGARRLAFIRGWLLPPGAASAKEKTRKRGRRRYIRIDSTCGAVGRYR